MKRQTNGTLHRALCVAVALLLLFAMGARAAGTDETRRYQSASKELQDGFWSLAEKDFTEFLKKFPESELYADVVVKKAQAQFKQGKFDELLGWLDSQQARAGRFADEFAYWKAEANYYKGNFAGAADGFDQLVNDFPASTRRIDAIVESADSRGRLGDWQRVVDSLGKADGQFQQLARANLADTNVVRGFFLLTEAQSARKEYAAAEKTLDVLTGAKLQPDREWGRQYLLCNLLLAEGKAQLAWETSTNLLNVATNRADLQAETMATRGEILERLGRIPDAIRSYETNLANDQLDIRRKALLRIVELNLQAGDLDAASARLRGYLAEHPTEKGSDLEWLTLGEVALRQYFGVRNPVKPTGTNAFLAEARSSFEKVIALTNSPLVAKAELNLGWCLAADGKLIDGASAFSNAIPRLPAFSEDRAVAQFKLGDVLYDLRDFVGAITSYKAVLGGYTTNAEMKTAARFVAANQLFPSKDNYPPSAAGTTLAGTAYDTQSGIKDGLFEQALYQIIRASIESTNLTEATNALSQILAWFPERLLGQPSMLLVGQLAGTVQGPAAARKVFADFVNRFPQSALLPEVKLAVARTYTAERDFPGAIARYDEWVRDYVTNAALPRAEFARASAYYADHQDAIAFGLFTNFVARFQSNSVALANELVPRAMIWIGDYHFQREEFAEAETKYQDVVRTWPNSDLGFRATMKCGQTAVARANPGEAIKLYFSNLAGNSNCPLPLRLQAQFEMADANVAVGATTNLAPYTNAIVIFSEIADRYPNSRLAPLARGRLGDCYRLLGAVDPAQFQSATNAYSAVVTNEFADITTRSMAAYGIAMTLEDMARLLPPTDQRPLLQAAVDRYLDIAYYEKNLRDNEHPDFAWVERAGMQAGKLLEAMGEWNLAINVYRKLAKDLPARSSVLEERAARIMREKQTAAKE